MDNHTSEYLFLNEMCNTIIACDFESSQAFFHLPCVVINNDHKHIFNTKKDMRLWLSAYSKRLDPESKEHLKFTLGKTVAMSPSVEFSQVNLQGLRLLKEKKRLDVSFTLASDVGETLKIMVVVLDDL
jgi:hypothetical protein